MSRPSRHQRKSIRFRVEKRKLAVKEQVRQNLSETRSEAPTAGSHSGKDNKHVLPRHVSKTLGTRAIDISARALKGTTHRGISQGSLKGAGTRPDGLTVKRAWGETRFPKVKVPKFKRFAKGRKAHLLDEVSVLDDKMVSPYTEQGLPEKRRFWIIKPGTKLGNLMGLKKNDKPIFIPKPSDNPVNDDTFTVKQGDKIINKGKLK